MTKHCWKSDERKLYTMTGHDWEGPGDRAIRKLDFSLGFEGERAMGIGSNREKRALMARGGHFVFLGGVVVGPPNDTPGDGLRGKSSGETANSSVCRGG